MRKQRIDAAGIQGIRAFAQAHGEHDFARVCDEALHNETWALDRISGALKLRAKRITEHWRSDLLAAIRQTDTTAPASAEPTKNEQTL